MEEQGYSLHFLIKVGSQKFWTTICANMKTDEDDISFDKTVRLYSSLFAETWIKNILDHNLCQHEEYLK